MSYDVIVIGARCAGAPTSLLLARAGLRVLIVDRADFPSDTVSGHMIKPAGVERLRRWGLLDAVLAGGCPRIEGRTVDLGVQRLHVPPGADALTPLAPRRTVLDELLLRAATDAGAEVRMQTSLTGLLSDGDRITGVRLREGTGRTYREPARLVVGADGRRSRVAQLVGAACYQAGPTVSLAYYAYWDDVDTSSVALYLRPGLAVGLFPTHHAQTLAFVQLPIARRAGFVRAVEPNYLAALRSLPEVAAGLDGARLTGRVVGMTDLPTFFRTPFGPGWALVGDAGHHKDPLVARGISDAFRDAELLAGAVLADEAGRVPLTAALRGYQRARDAAAAEVARLAARVAALDSLPDVLVRDFLALAAAERDADTADLANHQL